MDELYFDNAATSWPKPPEVLQAVADYWQTGGSLGRSTSRIGEDIARMIEDLRDDLARLIGANVRTEIVFCSSATDGLNLLIHGFLLRSSRASGYFANGAAHCSEKIRILSSHAEHNSVLRPLHGWVESGTVELQMAPCDTMGRLDVAQTIRQLKDSPAFDLVCLTHASNVTGIVNDLGPIGKYCQEHHVPFLIDAAQTVGHTEVDVRELGCDFLVAAGHKGLMGPLGTGFFYARESSSELVDSLRVGGTGASSLSVDSVLSSPEKWEAGNANVPGLVGLRAALPLLLDAEKSKQRRETVDALSKSLWDGLATIDGLQLIADVGHNPFGDHYGIQEEQPAHRVPVISCLPELLDVQTVSEALSQAGIVSRSGYHCAPLIHSILGTQAGGTLRLSPGPFSTVHQVEQVIETLASVLRVN